ncbi:N-formylglutamate amidohydrolase [Aurantimonas marina]|uniref:N-formylglutamate amidohydrolase n=1 Tax=Aurantimonas marina TaxID=2780508 RepID=UPI001E659905|nr:N-formylglutamate amidohydrolase [Aurantimonas marina]
MSEGSATLEEPSDGSRTQTVEVINPDGAGAILLVCEHASNAIPAEFGDLGIGAATKASHAAWDPGALAVARHLSEMFDAPLVAQTVSRLVYDCNRPPDAGDAIPARSEIHEIPGNTGLSAAARADRVERFYRPFERTLAQAVARHRATHANPVLLTIHSFTPIYAGERRSVEIGILHDSDRRLADAILDAADGSLDIRRNEPYGPADGVMHTLAAHAVPHGMANAMIEIRNDLIATPEDVGDIAERLTAWVSRAHASLTADAPKGSAL